LYYLKSAGKFVAKSQRVCQYWQSSEKSNTGCSINYREKFFSSTANNGKLADDILFFIPFRLNAFELIMQKSGTG
jgi:hypothetical protein